MIAATAPELAVSGNSQLADFRHRPQSGERSMLPESAPAAPKTPSSSNQGQFAQGGGQQDAPPEPALQPLHNGATFAAAVIAGALAPRPQSIEEVYARIGNAWIPPESEMRLRNLSV
ncbi:MAG TPA: hypothetical protein VLZ53_12710 [Devosia sp.]|nr:hypothetical protein [Devosia sp.]